MANPPSIVKIKKGELEFEDRSALVGWTMEQLQRRALMDVGRIVIYEVQKRVRARSKFLRKTRYAPKRYQYWVRRKENDLRIGVENKAKGAVTAWWADQSELGSNHQPKRPILQQVVQEKTGDIQKIYEQYLGLMDNETQAVAAAKEAPEEDVVKDG